MNLKKPLLDFLKFFINKQVKIINFKKNIIIPQKTNVQNKIYNLKHYLTIY